MYGTWPIKYSKFVTKIPIFTYSTLVHLDSTLNHSKSCREHFSLLSVQFWGQTDIICRSWKNNSKMMIFTDKIRHRPFESYKNDLYHPIGLKICQHTQIEIGHFLTCPIFNDNPLLNSKHFCTVLLPSIQNIDLGHFRFAPSQNATATISKTILILIGKKTWLSLGSPTHPTFTVSA